MLFFQVFSQLQSVVGGASLSLHLVEVSPVLSRLQAQKLTGSHSQEADAEDEPVYRRGETAAGLPVSWYRRLEDVPTGTPECVPLIALQRGVSVLCPGSGPSGLRCLQRFLFTDL